MNSVAGDRRFGGWFRRQWDVLRRVQGPLVGALGVALSLAALAVVVAELREQGMAPLSMLAQAGPLFWIAFVASLLVEPVTEYALLRRLIGVGRDVLPPLLRKQSLNNLLFGYAGDTYFAAWLQRHIGDTRRAFATVCDLAIVSALANNCMTILLLILVWQPIQALSGVRFDGWVALAAMALIALPVGLMSWRRMRTPSGHMGTILLFQSVRTVVATLLVALIWHLALPDIPLMSWLLLMAARLVVSRLPLVPNKDLAFAGIVALFMGADSRIAPMIAAVALLSFVAHGMAMLVLPGARRRGLARPAEACH